METIYIVSFLKDLPPNYIDSKVLGWVETIGEARDLIKNDIINANQPFPYKYGVIQRMRKADIISVCEYKEYYRFDGLFFNRIEVNDIEGIALW